MLGLVVIVGICWPWDWTNGFVPPAQKVPLAPASLADQISLSVWNARATGSPARMPTGAQEEWIRLAFEVQGLPDGLDLVGQKIDHTWRWTDGPSFVREGFTPYESGQSSLAAAVRRKFSLPVPQEDVETSRWHEARRAEMEAKRAASGRAPRTIPLRPAFRGTLIGSEVPLPPSIIARIHANPPAYEARIQAVVMRPEIVTEMPIRLNARGSSESRAFQVVRLAPTTGSRSLLPAVEGLDLRIVHTEPSAAKNGLWHMALLRSNARRQWGDAIMAANHVTGELNWLGTYGRGSSAKALIGGVAIGWESFRVHPGRLVRNDQFVLRDPEWLDHTTLVVLAGKAVGGFTRVVKADKFELEPSRQATDDAAR